MDITPATIIAVGSAFFSVGVWLGSYRGWRASINRRLKRQTKRIEDLEKTIAKEIQREYVPRFGDDDE